MKRVEIKVGQFYADSRGAVRQVIAMGPEFVLYPSQEETDNLRYLFVKKPKGRGSGPNIEGTEYNSTRAAFAQWAKKVVREM